MLKVIIVDDEAKGRKSLQQFLEEFCNNVTVVALAEDVLSGVKMIQLHQPDLVFLDIEMPSYSGFKLIEYFDEIDFDIVFTSAYEHYAFKAIKTTAIGYLLKPIDIDELVAIVEKVNLKRNLAGTTDQAIENQIKKNITNENRLVWPSVNGVVYFNLEEVAYLVSEGRYTNIFLKDNASITTTYSLKECEDLLKASFLMRIHRSFIVNLSFVKKYSKGKDCFVQLENEVKIDVGKKFKDEFAEAITLFLK